MFCEYFRKYLKKRTLDIEKIFKEKPVTNPREKVERDL
jgi:hypothetical protein